MQGTIWLDEHDYNRTTKELIGVFGCELRKCEQLLVMGYNYSNRVDLAKRRTWLTNHIADLEIKYKQEKELAKKLARKLDKK